ncbi:MAG: 3-octaprenyl-4-hydroxybenzoate carboxy-lyase [Deltaproteobacteria bacterium]|nr:MAG: 3-octaprenyl-4-hydroxybenzoate carboxy-lyase [Deltaproteobacteria bacterium]PIE74923.1 MAG: 3-octaprenyl-4-hydroxybenzoate carboxy-lyase [Deltaproteobacteria bacterium]
MIYKSLKQACDDLFDKKMLVKIKGQVDPNLEMAEIHRRINEKQGPAVFFENVKGSDFPAVSNLFGTKDRALYLFKDTIGAVKRLVSLKKDPFEILKHPMSFPVILKTLLNSIPKKSQKGRVLYSQTTLDRLPRIKCWPEDGGGFILLPQVYSESPLKKNIFFSNTGMYRVQISGNEYKDNCEAGIHYQIERGIGIHHQKAIEKGEKLKISIFAGGPPAHTLAAIMPLPHNIPEVFFAGALSGRRFRYKRVKNNILSMDADFCITGELSLSETRPEGPFGDHLGYYSLVHEFPFIKITNIYHAKDAVWPFTVVGRPPQEDSIFGELIHEITKPAVSVSIPGVEAVHAVDSSGVHPLMFAIGHERYVPYSKREPMELMNQANAILGFGQCCLAKYLFVSAYEDNPELDINNERKFLEHILERIDFKRDLHFHTKTLIDTLDYSGESLNFGSKLVICSCGEKKRTLKDKIPADLNLPGGFIEPKIVSPGILSVQGPAFNDKSGYDDIERLCSHENLNISEKDFGLIVVCDDSEFVSRKFENFLWAAFTRSNPSHDVNGIGSFCEFKHFGCIGPMVIDARIKPWHAKELVPDEKICEKVDRFFKKSGELYGLI